MITRTWLTQDLLYDSGIHPPQVLDDMLFKYHSFYTFCLLASGMIFFVLSLEEGFYAYQFRQMGWSILSLMVIVGSGHGLLLSLWKVRIWFIYSVLCLYLRDVVDCLVTNFIGGPPIHHLSPKSSILGFIVGGLCAFGFYFQVSVFNLTYCRVDVVRRQYAAKFLVQCQSHQVEPCTLRSQCSAR